MLPHRSTVPLCFNHCNTFTAYTYLLSLVTVVNLPNALRVTTKHDFALFSDPFAVPPKHFLAISSESVAERATNSQTVTVRREWSDDGYRSSIDSYNP